MFFFAPRRNQFQNKTFSSVIFYPLNTLKGTTKAPVVDFLTLNTLRDTKTAFLMPKMYDEHPCPFYMGVFNSPPWGVTP